ncbi:MAG: 4-hydroxy-3-methylbut-2-en-1-yl diphosphate synthase [Actinobacteria bacterium HGW-Actinobacteria-1]|jgi:(E)-4-hydroxy-3-methylbut-2-enyl-diphosphate synthase|nr:MAG: 4-hydroxy-3-methylbut-2-en-1-yl diphosphate synthase [Actinobacteria bacterium HGW-Actinobacteria-1]
MIERRHTRQVAVGSVKIGGGAPIAVQSMTNTDTRDSAATLAQITRLAEAGCEIVRVAIPHADALPGFGEICSASPLPVVADIHFDHRLAIEATRLGAAKLRINPGNIGSIDRVDAVIEAAGEAGIPVRIGVNAGSLAAEYEDRDWPLAEKLFASAVSFCEHIAGRGFEDLVVSAKASSVNATVDSYRLLANALPYPLHIGVTEAGTSLSGTVKSSVGLGILLAEGIGDTLRVSLTADPAEEVTVGWEILAALDIRRRSPELVSCPTCGRCEVDMVPIAQEVERRLRTMRTPVKVAVMGCAVNGPGEARDADVGIASGKGVGLLFRHGQVIRKVPEAEIVEALMAEVEALDRELSQGAK